MMLRYNQQQFDTKGALLDSLGIKRYHNLLHLVAIYTEIVATESKYIGCESAE